MIFPPKPNFTSKLLSIVTAQLYQMNLKATKEADCYMHIYFNAFKQRIVLMRGYKARKNKTESKKLVGIVLVLGLYWYC
jgi:hypothetical protein